MKNLIVYSSMIGVLVLLAVSCVKDPIDRLADEATRSGMAAFRDPSTRNSAFAVAAEKPIRVYYLAKYQATPEQIREARERARRIPDPPASVPSQKPTPRYRAIPVKNPVPKAKSEVAVMLYDTSSERVVGASVYELAEVPSPGQDLILDTFATQYVGQ